MAEQLGQPILGKFVASTVVGLAPRIMGISPTLAIPKLLTKLGIDQQEVDIFEINEAFASMVRRLYRAYLKFSFTRRPLLTAH
jgi:acetyl-CoA acyltransferase 1